MEQTYTHNPLLELLEHPAFCVGDGIILQANQAAQQRMITTGEPIAKYLQQDLQAYQEFSGGCLYLTLNIDALCCGAAVTELDTCHLFVMDTETEPKLEALALAAQQLRAPMNTVFLAADLLKDRKQASQLNRGLNQMHRIICNMADAVRYYNRESARMETTNLCSVFAEAMDKAGALLLSSGRQMKYTALPESVIGMADREMLERAVYNLVSNAVKFSDKNAPLEAKLVHKGNLLYFTLQDKGEGIPQDIQKTLFIRYLRNPSVEDSRHGIGLGLSMVRSAAALHSGTVLIDFPEGGGTRVTMTISVTGCAGNTLRSPIRLPQVDYAGGYDHCLLELSEVLPPTAYKE